MSTIYRERTQDMPPQRATMPQDATNGPNMASDTFGAVLAAYRQRQRLSQNRLGTLAGFDHSFLSRIEAGKRDASRDTVTALADALDLAGPDRARLFASAGFLETDAIPAYLAWLDAVQGVGR